MSGPVLAAYAWPTNAHLIEACATLGYLGEDRATLDCTYGKGTFWKRWKPSSLTATDLDPAKSPSVPVGVDFTAMPWPDEMFPAVVFDPPYKLNGTPSAPDERYGADVVRSWQDRHGLIKRGMTECRRVLAPGGYLLVKCQDQVCSGKVRWQTREFADHGEALGLELVDRLDRLGGRAQPAGRRQVHAHQRPSSMLVFEAPR